MHKKTMMLVLIFGVLGTAFLISTIFSKRAPIKIGILHSLTGYMALSERPVVDAALLAIEEINAAGGVLGRMIEPIIADGASDRETFAKQAEKLITEKKVEAIFGTRTSADRKAVKDVVEKYDIIFFSPAPYEGVETSSNTIYTGATANQQLLPAIVWCSEHIGKRFFVAGSQEIYSSVAGIIIRALLDSIHADLVGEAAVPLGTKDVAGIIQEIKRTKPDVIINTIYSDTNIYFFKALRAAGITPDIIPTISVSIAEPEIQEIGPAIMAGDYASCSYFQSVTSVENALFMQAFKKRYGEDRVISDTMEAAYFGIYMWHQAVKLAETADPLKVFKTVQNQNWVAPEGNVSIDGYNHNTWKVSRIGKINPEGQFDIVWSSEKTIYPVPYLFKSAEEWDEILREIYIEWGGAWARD